MFGVSYHWYGICFVTGMRPASSETAWRQWPKLGKLTMPWRATRAISRNMPSALCTACKVCDSTTVSNMLSENILSPASRFCWITLMRAFTQRAT
jgi:hypothetical protein